MNVATDKPVRKPKRWIGEVVTVTTVVMVFVALMLPVYTGDKRLARPTTCLSNLKQLLAGVQLYATDCDDQLPIYYTFDGQKETESFIESTMPYLKKFQIYVCPEDQVALNAASNPTHLPGETHTMSYVHCLSLKGLVPDFSKGGRSLLLTELRQDKAATPYLREPVLG